MIFRLKSADFNENHTSVEFNGNYTSLAELCEFQLIYARIHMKSTNFIEIADFIEAKNISHLPLSSSNVFQMKDQ